MRHVYFRVIIGLVWLAAAFVSALSGGFGLAGCQVILCGIFWFSAYTAWKKEKDGKGEN